MVKPPDPSIPSQAAFTTALEVLDRLIAELAVDSPRRAPLVVARGEVQAAKVAYSLERI